MPGIEDRLQRASEQIVGSGFGLLRTHRNLARCWGFSRVDHDPAAMGIPYVQAREKSQGFGGFGHETLRFLILSKPE